jgi:hypothetical protein
MTVHEGRQGFADLARVAALELISHLAGIDGNRWFMIESWTTREAQEKFMQSRLGAAMGEGGISATPKVTWATVMGEPYTGG